MNTRSALNELWLVACFGIGCWGCTVTSGVDPGAAGAPGTGGTTGTGGSQSSGGMTSVSGVTNMCSSMTVAPPAPAAGAAQGPCDIYAADGGPCVAAHSTVRALYAEYSGPLYQVKKTDGTTKDIAPLAPGGPANAADQDTFCGIDACTISTIYDQSGKGNHLKKTPAGGGAKPTEDNEANAKGVTITVGGHALYGVHVVPGVGYRNNTPCGTVTGDNPETEYMVVAGSSKDGSMPYNGGCCFDYGNMETNSHDNGEGTMEAVYFGTCTIWGKGADNGPWVMGDLENGLWAGNESPFVANTPVTFPFVFGMVKGDAAGKNHWTIKVANAQAAGSLTVPFDGQRPSSRYTPMRKEGAIGLGTGGDNSSAAKGDWFEGVMTATYASDAADQAVHANIVSFYGQP